MEYFLMDNCLLTLLKIFQFKIIIVELVVEYLKK